MHYPLVHHQHRAVWPIAFRSKRLYHISVLTISMESKGNVNKHHKNSEIDSFEMWHIKRTTQIGLWSHCRYVGQYIHAFAMLTVFVLSHAIVLRHVWRWVEFHPHHCLRGDWVLWGGISFTRVTSVSEAIYTVNTYLYFFTKIRTYDAIGTAGKLR